MSNLHPRTDAAPPPRLFALLGLEPGEARPVASMVGLNFGVSAAFVLVQTSAFGLFIEAFGSHALPYAYFSVAILSSLIAYLYLQVSQRVSFRSSLYLNLSFLAAVSLVFWLGLRSAAARWFIFLLPFWFQTLVNLANLVVWHLAGHMFHVRQAKRLFGLIVGGNWIANIVGGVLVAAFLGSSSPSNLYLLAAIALMLSTLVLRGALANYRAQAAPVAARRPSQDDERAAVRAALAHPYSRLIFLYTLLWWLAFFILENIFFHQVEGELESSAALAGFLAWQLAVMGVIALFTTLVLTSRVVRRFGLRLGLLVMPAVVTLAILLLAAGGSLGWSPGFLFWTATAARTLNIALGFSLSQAMGSLLFQPLQGQLRGAAQTISEGIVQPLAIGAAGAILLIFNTTLGLDAVGLAYVFLLVAIPWFWSILALSRRYPLVMSDALKKRALGESTTLLFDASAVDLLRRAMHQPQPGQALYALNQLEQLAPESWPDVLAKELPQLLQHPSAEVRLEALRRVLRLLPPDCAALLRDRFRDEAEPRVKSMLLRILATMQDPDSVEDIAAAIDSTDRIMQHGAIIGLLSVPETDLSVRAAAALQRLSESPDAGERLDACRILAEVTPPPAVAQLQGLLRDEELSVRHAALRAAHNQFDAHLIRPVIDVSGDPACSRLAEAVLTGFAAVDAGAVLHEISDVLQEGIRSPLAYSLIRVLGRIADPEATSLLIAAVDSAEPQYRLQALLSLSRLGYRAPSAPEILRRVRGEVAHAVWLSAALQGEDSLRGWAALREALSTDLGETRGRILLLLSFIYDARAVLLARNALGEAGSAHSAMALETIDALLPSSAKPVILPLLEDSSHAGRLARWRTAGLAAPEVTPEDVLRALVSAEDAAGHPAWTRMCAMHVIGLAGVKACLQALETEPGVDAAFPAIERMRRWSLARLSPLGVPKGEKDMLSLVEKVLILKSAPIFAGTSDSVLAEVAGFVEETSFETDQVIFQKGDPGDSLYVIVSGSVRVWDGERLLNELREGEAFGELALLDPEPRLGTVRAAEPTHLLRLDSASFREVLESQPEVSFAILRVVTKYLRSQLQYARDASERLRALESPAPISQSAEA